MHLVLSLRTVYGVLQSLVAQPFAFLSFQAGSSFSASPNEVAISSSFQDKEAEMFGKGQQRGRCSSMLWLAPVPALRPSPSANVQDPTTPRCCSHRATAPGPIGTGSMPTYDVHALPLFTRNSDSLPGKRNDANVAVKHGRTLTQLMGPSFNLIDNVLKNTPLHIVSVLRQR